MAYFNPASFWGFTCETETQMQQQCSLSRMGKEALTCAGRVKPEEGLVRSKNMFLYRTFYSFLMTNPLGGRGEDHTRQMTEKMTFMPRSQ